MISEEHNTGKRSDNFQKIVRRQIHSGNELNCDKTKRLYQWWSSYAPAIPSRDDFDITKVPSLAPHIYLFEVLEPGKYLYRLCGENVSYLVGRNYHMTEISLDSFHIADSLLAEYLDWMLISGGVNGCHGDMSFFNKEHIKFESIDCPLINSEGKTTHIIGVLCAQKD